VNDNQSLLCECGKPKTKRAVGCARCKEIERSRLSNDTRKIVLATLSRLDWASAFDVCVALEMGHVPGRYSRMLATLCEEGTIVSRGKGSGLEYRLVQRKRRAA
jgi:hypothetical protein